MSQKSSSEIMEKLFAELNNIAMPSDTSPNAPPPAGFACMMIPGETVLSETYDTSTKNGKKNLYTRMDKIPAYNKQYIDSTRSISALFEQILGANTPADNPEEAKKKEAEYKKAEALLASDKYDDYLDCQADYQDAVDDFLYLENQIPQDERELKKAQRAMERAKKTWVARGYKNVIEDALSTSARYLAYTPKSVYAAAQEKFEKERELTNIDSLLPVVCLPENWSTDPSKLSWTHVIITQKKQTSKTHHTVDQIDSEFSAKLNYGLWSVSASGGYHDRVEKLNKLSETDSLGFAFDIAKIAINRSWFNSNLLSYSGVSIQGMKKGELCAGSLDKATECLYPAVPTAFLVARNINIYNEFSSEEESFFDECKSWSAEARVGFGPFSIGNKTSSSKKLTETEKETFGNSIKITVGDGMQIIGFVCSVLTPAFPTAESTHRSAEDISAQGETVSIDPILLAKLNNFAQHTQQYGSIVIDDEA